MTGRGLRSSPSIRRSGTVLRGLGYVFETESQFVRARIIVRRDAHAAFFPRRCCRR